jgi:hypothetical protein
MNYTYPPAERVAKAWLDIVEHLRQLFEAEGRAL